MSNLNYKRFHRILTRCKELGTAKDTKPIVSQIYQSSAQAPIETFIGIHQALSQKESSSAKENQEANSALDAIDGPFRVARAAALAFVPTLSLPETLKQQPTLTDKLLAIESLLDAIDDYMGTPWADELLKGEFGTLAPKVIQEVTESQQADKELADARQARAAAYGPAYEKYIAFKRLVRAQYGASSLEYRRIHLRASGGDEEQMPEAEGGAPKKVGE